VFDHAGFAESVCKIELDHGPIDGTARARPLWVKSGLMQCSNACPTSAYSIGDAFYAANNSRRLARAVRYINSPKRRRNCSSSISSIESAPSRITTLNSSLSEDHSLGLASLERIGPQRHTHRTCRRLSLRPLPPELVLHVGAYLMRCRKS
jgi:hypothetical protein